MLWTQLYWNSGIKRNEPHRKSTWSAARRWGRIMALEGAHHPRCRFGLFTVIIITLLYGISEKYPAFFKRLREKKWAIDWVWVLSRGRESAVMRIHREEMYPLRGGLRDGGGGPVEIGGKCKARGRRRRTRRRRRDRRGESLLQNVTLSASWERASRAGGGEEHHSQNQYNRWSVCSWWIECRLIIDVWYQDRDFLHKLTVLEMFISGQWPAGNLHHFNSTSSWTLNTLAVLYLPTV